MKLSILDQLPVTTGNTQIGAVDKTIELALLGDILGYHRMWFAEHHGSKIFSSSAPEIITAHIAALTKQIRLGTGGTMIQHYSPLKIAEVFKTLESLAPGRIDLGMGRAPGGDMNATKALASSHNIQFDPLYNKLETILSLVADVHVKDPLYQKTPAVPTDASLPEAWLLGSTGNSAQEAARQGLGYSFAQFFMGQMSKEIFDLYRNNFKSSVFLEKPTINVAYLVTIAEDPEEAEFEAGPADLQRLQLQTNRPVEIMTPEKAVEYKKRLSIVDRMRIEEGREKIHLVGTPKEVSQRILQDQMYYGFDEAMIVSITHSQEKRLDAYKLLAKELL